MSIITKKEVKKTDFKETMLQRKTAKCNLHLLTNQCVGLCLRLETTRQVRQLSFASKNI